jgi:predicted  nucleic acid-binding Zn-ribbon protein
MTDLEINEAFGKPMYEADPTNARYNSLQLQCYEQRKEINRLNEHVTELENRLRALWDKLEYERKYYEDRIKRLEEDLMDAKNKHAALVADVTLYEDRGERIKQLEEALWLKQPISTAKEDKP